MIGHELVSCVCSSDSSSPCGLPGFPLAATHPRSTWSGRDWILVALVATTIYVSEVVAGAGIVVGCSVEHTGDTLVRVAPPRPDPLGYCSPGGGGQEGDRAGGPDSPGHGEQDRFGGAVLREVVPGSLKNGRQAGGGSGSQSTPPKLTP